MCSPATGRCSTRISRRCDAILERQAGRPWDKVYSEIARHLRAENTVHQHVRDHLNDFVAIKPRRLSGTLYTPGGGKRGDDRLWYQPLYVDPKDGLLKRTDRLPEAKALRHTARRRPAPPDRISLAPDRELRRIDGLWFEVTLALLPDPEFRVFQEVRKIPLKRTASASPIVEMEMTVRRLATPSVRDVVRGALVLAGPEVDEERAWAEYRRTHPDRRYAVRKQALSRVKLKRHGLSNLQSAD